MDPILELTTVPRKLVSGEYEHLVIDYKFEQIIKAFSLHSDATKFLLERHASEKGHQQPLWICRIPLVDYQKINEQLMAKPTVLRSLIAIQTTE